MTAEKCKPCEGGGLIWSSSFSGGRRRVICYFCHGSGKSTEKPVWLEPKDKKDSCE